MHSPSWGKEISLGPVGLEPTSFVQRPLLAYSLSASSTQRDSEAAVGGAFEFQSL